MQPYVLDFCLFFGGVGDSSSALATPRSHLGLLAVETLLSAVHALKFYM